jgi:outer membrane protein assembly factor BamB
MKALTAFLLVVTGSILASAQDWTQWRGPSRSGRTVSFTPPAEWPARPTRVWQVAAGEGHASPVVSGARAYLLSRIGEQEAVTAFELATGKQIWRQVSDAPYRMNPAATAHGKGPKSTPLVYRGRVYTLGIGGGLTALNEADGTVAWRRDFKTAFPAASPAFGAAMSPVADGDLVIAHAGGEGNGALLAFDAATGAPRWSWKGDGPAYASPIVADLGGVRQVVTLSQSHLVGVAVADGALLWKRALATDYDQNSVTPLVFEDLLIYGGLSKPTTAIRVRRAGGKWVASEAWSNADAPVYMSSPVEAGGVVYGLTHRNRGQYFALDARTGALLWTSPGRQGENAAIVAAGPVLIVTTTEGELVILRRDAKAFAVLRKYTLSDSPIWAHPAPAGRGLLIKNAGTLSFWTF